VYWVATGYSDAYEAVSDVLRRHGGRLDEVEFAAFDYALTDIDFDNPRFEDHYLTRLAKAYVLKEVALEASNNPKAGADKDELAAQALYFGQEYQAVLNGCLDVKAAKALPQIRSAYAEFVDGGLVDRDKFFEAVDDAFMAIVEP
jgi:hypothetical protein